MYAHLNVVQIPADQLDTYIDTLRTSGVPVLKEQPGYEATLVLADSQRGKAIAITFFQTAADCQATENFFDEQRAKMGSSLDISLNAPEHYQVKIADGNWGGPASAPSAHSQDWTSWAFYDADGQVIYSVDALGKVTSSLYDSSGEAITSVLYAAPLSPSTDEDRGNPSPDSTPPS